MLVYLILSSLAVTPIQGLTAFREYSLATTCTSDGSKKNMYLNSGALVLTFNSSTRGLNCHLEVHTHSKSFGISVFIDTLRLDTSQGCSREYLQFGRDKAFITTHTSQKNCDLYPSVTDIYSPEKPEQLVNYDFKSKTFLQRQYLENEDIEMDIWLKLEPSSSYSKEVKLLVAPYKKTRSCQYDDYYHQCPGTDRCYKRQLFCQGIVKCSVLSSEEWERLCPNKKDQDNFLYLPVIIIIIVFSIISVSLLGFGIKLLLKYLGKSRAVGGESSNSCSESTMFRSPVNPARTTESRSGSRHSQAEPEEPQLPLHPPPYSEVVGLGYKDNPPEYSELVELQTNLPPPT